METLIEKWKPVLEYKFKSGKSVHIYKHEECAERLKNMETNDILIIFGLVVCCLLCLKALSTFVFILKDHHRDLNQKNKQHNNKINL
jgi:hypothetical protein